MTKVLRTTRAQVVRERGAIRRATLESAREPVRYGVHGGIKAFFGVEPEEDLPATLDHLVAAVGV